ncbi:MAG: restriction endonuclease subunit S, partial [Clostridiales bacterium]|nr:restriction endonuclease subunit S [Clostridiales bacterium]
YLQTYMFFVQKRKLAQGTKVIEVTPRKLENVKIPIPPLAEQERIASILDKFDALVNDISIGIPAEIEARQKQYEYYREKLLTFKSA